MPRRNIDLMDPLLTRELFAWDMVTKYLKKAKGGLAKRRGHPPRNIDQEWIFLAQRAAKNSIDYGLFDMPDISKDLGRLFALDVDLALDFFHFVRTKYRAIKRAEQWILDFGLERLLDAKRFQKEESKISRELKHEIDKESNPARKLKLEKGFKRKLKKRCKVLCKVFVPARTPIALRVGVNVQLIPKDSVIEADGPWQTKPEGLKQFIPEGGLGTVREKYEILYKKHFAKLAKLDKKTSPFAVNKNKHICFVAISEIGRLKKFDFGSFSNTALYLPRTDAGFIQIPDGPVNKMAAALGEISKEQVRWALTLATSGDPRLAINFLAGTLELKKNSDDFAFLSVNVSKKVVKTEGRTKDPNGAQILLGVIVKDAP
jgi:hypothetical protein